MYQPGDQSGPSSAQYCQIHQPPAWPAWQRSMVHSGWGPSRITGSQVSWKVAQNPASLTFKILTALPQFTIYDLRVHYHQLTGEKKHKFYSERHQTAVRQTLTAAILATEQTWKTVMRENPPSGLSFKQWSWSALGWWRDVKFNAHHRLCVNIFLVT